MATVTLSTGIPVPVLGTVNIAASLIDSAATSLKLQWDVSQHLTGDPATMLASVDVSLDGGLTWNFLCSAGRDRGYPNSTIASLIHPLPDVGNTLRMLRASLTTSSSVTTSMQLVVS